MMKMSLRMLAHPIWMFFALPWLMILLVFGTVAQRYIGLYASQKLFFGSFVLWAGPVPLPGAYATLLLLSINLIAKLVFKSVFTWQRAGTLLVHISAIVLLLGGLISALAREEGYMVLGDGDSSHIISDYRLRELKIEDNGKVIAAIPYGQLRAGDIIKADAQLTLTIIRTCFPCGLVVRSQLKSPGNMHGVAQRLELSARPYSKEDALNLAGVEFSVWKGVPDGNYIAFEGLAAPDAITVSGHHYTIGLKPVERILPFDVRLMHFTKSDYPGTEEARAYRSDVEVSDNGLKWKTTIEMNQPLRYKGYTLYQSSYVTDGDKQLSVLAVVKNAGVWFPYIAISMLCAGLLLHIAIMLRPRRQ